MAKSDLTSAAPDFNSVRSFRRAIADDVCENSRELFFGFTRGFVKNVSHLNSSSLSVGDV